MLKCYIYLLKQVTPDLENAGDHFRLNELYRHISHINFGKIGEKEIDHLGKRKNHCISGTDKWKFDNSIWELDE